MMNIYLILAVFVVGLVGGVYISQFGENKLMGDYDLYNCIYNNAESNNFPQHPVMIQKIQDECICFREHNFTNLLEVNCSR